MLPSTEFDKTSSGVLLSKVTYDVNRVMAAATDALVILIRDTLIVIGLLAWMFYLNWKLSLIVFSIMPLMILVIRFVSKRLRNMNTSMQEAMGMLFAPIKHLTKINEQLQQGLAAAQSIFEIK